MCCVLYIACSCVVCSFVVRRFLFGGGCLWRPFVVRCLPSVVRCMLRVDVCVLCCELFVACACCMCCLFVCLFVILYVLIVGRCLLSVFLVVG